MPELEGQLDIYSVIKDETEGEPSAARALKVLAMAKEHGWTENPHCSLVLRLTREDALPFYCRWDLSFSSETGKKSWRFHGARAINGQPLNYQDVFAYLQDPNLIYPEMPDQLAEAAGHEDPDQTEAKALEALKPIAKPAIPSTDWGALLGALS